MYAEREGEKEREKKDEMGWIDVGRKKEKGQRRRRREWNGECEERPTSRPCILGRPVLGTVQWDPTVAVAIELVHGRHDAVGDCEPLLGLLELEQQEASRIATSRETLEMI